MKMPTEKNGSKKLFVMWETIPANLKQVSELPNHPILISKSPLPISKLKFFTKNLQRKRNSKSLKPKNKLEFVYEVGAKDVVVVADFDEGDT